eukprot:1503304-Rhodomonas_salina.1
MAAELKEALVLEAQVCSAMPLRPSHRCPLPAYALPAAARYPPTPLLWISATCLRNSCSCLLICLRVCCRCPERVAVWG